MIKQTTAPDKKEEVKEVKKNKKPSGTHASHGSDAQQSTPTNRQQAPSSAGRHPTSSNGHRQPASASGGHRSQDKSAFASSGSSTKAIKRKSPDDAAEHHDSDHAKLQEKAKKANGIRRSPSAHNEIKVKDTSTGRSESPPKRQRTETPPTPSSSSPTKAVKRKSPDDAAERQTSNEAKLREKVKKANSIRRSPSADNEIKVKATSSGSSNPSPKRQCTATPPASPSSSTKSNKRKSLDVDDHQSAGEAAQQDETKTASSTRSGSQELGCEQQAVNGSKQQQATNVVSSAGSSEPPAKRQRSTSPAPGTKISSVEQHKGIARPKDAVQSTLHTGSYENAKRPFAGIERKATEESRVQRWKLEYCQENNCFSNSVLQALGPMMDVDGLTKALSSLPYPTLRHDTTKAIGCTSKACLEHDALVKEIKNSDDQFNASRELLAVLTNLRYAPSDGEVPVSSRRYRSVLEKLGGPGAEFDGEEQEDAGEYLTYLFGQLSEDLYDTDVVKANELQTDFMSKTETKRTCSGCGRQTTSSGSHWMYDLVGLRPGERKNMTVSLDTLVARSWAPETLTDFKCDNCFQPCSPDCNKDNCPLCVANILPQQQITSFSSLPKNLILNINRNVIGKGGSPSNRKIRARIELAEFHILEESTADGIKPVRYKLTAVVSHESTQSDRGHYVCFREKDGTWYKCDDEDIDKCESLSAIRKDVSDTSLVFLTRVD